MDWHPWGVAGERSVAGHSLFEKVKGRLSSSLFLKLTYDLLLTLDEEKVLHIDADVTTISQLYIQRQLTAKCLDVPFERRDFNFVAAFFQIGDGGLRYSKCRRQIML